LLKVLTYSKLETHTSCSPNWKYRDIPCTLTNGNITTGISTPLLFVKVVMLEPVTDSSTTLDSSFSLGTKDYKEFNSSSDIV
jgi:hypothetical protein